MSNTIEKQSWTYQCTYETDKKKKIKGNNYSYRKVGRAIAL